MHCTRRIAKRVLSSSFPRRHTHSVPVLPLASAESEGVPGLYSPTAYKLAWTDYQSHVIQNLNRVAAETEYDNLPLIKTIAQTARQPENATIYNFAAQAFSNHFFFESITNTPKSSLSDSSNLHQLRSEIERSFTSIREFEDHFTATATSLLGSGWVWLVLDQSETLRILTTYNAGTPFDFARIQHADPNTGLVPFAVAGQDNSRALYQSMKRVYSLTPILCLSVWEHSYLTDFGYSKKDYVEQWLKHVDWDKVEERRVEAKSA